MNKLSFDVWNEQKKAIDARPAPTVFAHARDVWFSTLGHNIDVEMNGGGDQFSRPVLVIKSFNSRMVWIVPLTSKPKSHDFHFKFIDPSGLQVAANVAQLRLISAKRLERRIYRMEQALFDDIVDRIRHFLS